MTTLARFCQHCTVWLHINYIYIYIYLSEFAAVTTALNTALQNQSVVTTPTLKLRKMPLKCLHQPVKQVVGRLVAMHSFKAFL